MGDRRHGRVHMSTGTCALVQSRVNCWYTPIAWVPEGRVGGRSDAGALMLLVVGVRMGVRMRVSVSVSVGVNVGVGAGVSVGVGCQVQVLLRLSFLAKVDLHGSPR
jgi:hypothetical protein